jgi:hypothetical protein
MDALVALDLVREVDGGYRIALPDSEAERGQRIVPAPVDDDHAAGHGLVFDVALALVEDTEQVTDPDDPLGSAFHWPQDLDAARTAHPPLDPWIRIAQDLADDADPPPATVSIGPEVDASQVSLQAAAGGEML